MMKWNYIFGIIGIQVSFPWAHKTLLNVDKEELHDLNGYAGINRYGETEKGGGVSLYILQGTCINSTLRNDLDYFDSEMETVFIEIDKSIFNTDSNIVLRQMYRMPNSTVDVFNDCIFHISNVIKKEHKLCYFVGRS